MRRRVCYDSSAPQRPMTNWASTPEPPKRDQLCDCRMLELSTQTCCAPGGLELSYVAGSVSASSADATQFSPNSEHGRPSCSTLAPLGADAEESRSTRQSSQPRRLKLWQSPPCSIPGKPRIFGGAQLLTMLGILEATSHWRLLAVRMCLRIVSSLAFHAQSQHCAKPYPQKPIINVAPHAQARSS